MFGEVFERMCQSIMLVSHMGDLNGKRVGEMSYLTLYDYVKKPKSALGKRKQQLRVTN